MITIIIIAFLSLIGLIVLHELGHFLLAKKFGVKVEEFGIGYPPRIFGKKFGQTIYSLNLLPFGAFVRMQGHEDGDRRPGSFSIKPFWQKALIILGGVVVFWIVSAILLSIVMSLGVPTIVEDSESGLVDPKIQIVGIAKSSPAEEAGLQIGDVLNGFSVSGSRISVNKIKDTQEVINNNKEQEIILIIQRGGEVLDLSLIPRAAPPEDEGPIGVALVRTALKSYPWYVAPIKGIEATFNLTVMIIDGWWITLKSLFCGTGMPAGVEVRGIVGIFELFVQAGAMGVSYFLQLIAIISISLALINVLPIPALDGGWFVFLVIEKLSGKPLNQKVVQTISLAFFLLLIILMIWVNIRDVGRLF